jgi:sulfate transport system permease protein
MTAIALALGSLPSGRQPSVIPGFGRTLGLTLAYLAAIVLLPLAALFFKASGIGWAGFVETITAPRVVAAFKVSFGLSLAAALVNAVAGAGVAWVLVRYRFPGKRVIDALVDLPFALPTAVAGISLASLYADSGWLGGLLAPFGIEVAFTRLGILVALIFIGLPFVVRTLQPLLADLDRSAEEAAVTLGASRWNVFRRVLLPPIFPGLLTGTALAFARAVGEYGSVIFIAGNMPGISEIVPLVIVFRLEQYDYAGAAAIASVMLLVSLAMLLAINLLQIWTRRHGD